ncbi:chromosomal replication initiator protein DnaA [candidate division KSB1 bacterium]|nr:chromosomal replication initiator protein DnaA [candidate division KSB1 bacterium]RQW02437.1 MAG: chromosomal replication initiator protein DnaA [candidate division KSB1 bacterium]
MSRQIDQLWSSILENIKKEVNGNSYATWFKTIKPAKIDGATLTIQVPSQFFYEWLETHYSDVLNRAIMYELGPSAKLLYSVIIDSSIQSMQLPSMKKTAPKAKALSNINERFTFDSFVEGDCNKFAKAASMTVAKSPGGTTFNPLLVYGGVGLGKTHLIQAIGNLALLQGLVNRVMYVDSERFTMDFIDSIQKNKTTEFSSQYRTVDLLIVDDIQFFSNKERTQDEFFHTFNALHNKGKQIVLSSDRPPKELNGIEERLISRFQWGLVVDIQSPDLETRQAILQKKAEENGLELPVEIFQFIAANITSNIRELEGALIRLLAYASLNGEDITLDLAKRLLKDVCLPQMRAISIEFIQKTAADYFGFPDDMMRAKTRKKEIAQARQIAMYLCKKLTDNSLKTIGLHFGGRDHTTVIHALTTVEHMLKNDAKVQDQVDAIKNKIEIAQL